MGNMNPKEGELISIKSKSQSYFDCKYSKGRVYISKGVIGNRFQDSFYITPSKGFKWSSNERVFFRAFWWTFNSVSNMEGRKG